MSIGTVGLQHYTGAMGIEKIMTRNPCKGKHGFEISKQKYDLIRASIVEILTLRPLLTFTELTEAIEERMGKPFDGSIPWYSEVVKLDLEARHVIRRVPQQDKSKDRYELTPELAL